MSDGLCESHHRVRLFLRLQLIALAMQVLMLYYGRQFIQDGQMTTGSLVSFVLYQSQLGLGIRVRNPPG